MTQFPDQLRHWRGRRRLSQLALSAEAEVSARHLSFLESGRARPSREMVLRLGEALELPLAERNRLLEAAGFAAHYRAAPADDAAIAPVRRGMERLLTRHDPWPALIMDRRWRLTRLNASAARLFALAGLDEGSDLLAWLTTPGQGAAMIENWPEAGHHLARRLRADSRAAGGIDALDRAAARLMGDPAISGFQLPERASPFVPTIYRAGDLRLALTSTLAQFAGSDDLALSDLRIELMFPADEAAEEMLASLATPHVSGNLNTS